MFRLTHRKYVLVSLFLLITPLLSGIVNTLVFCDYSPLDLTTNYGCVLESIFTVLYLVALGLWAISTILVAYAEIKLILSERKAKQASKKVVKKKTKRK